MRQKLLAGALIAVTTLLTACETMTTSRRVSVSASEQWVILPFENLSQTPLAGDRAKSFAETHLRAQGVRHIAMYEPEGEQNLSTLLDNAAQLETARQWARENGYVYGVTGTVQEWQYKNGLDNEPSVSVTLKFVQLQDEEVMWLATSTRTGWGYENLAGVGSKTIASMIDEVRFVEPRRVTRVVNRTPAVAEPMNAAATPAPVAPAPLPPAPGAPMPLQQEPIPAAALPAPQDGNTTTVPAPADDTQLTPYLTNLRENTNR